MKKKHITLRKKQCLLLAETSTCTRRKVGSVIVEPESNIVISEGYNGPPRKAPFSLCGGEKCLRSAIKSGTQNDVGCHHAEMNAILNASRTGNSTLGKWLFTSCDPCLMCAKAIHHAGITKVFLPLLSQEAHADGLHYLRVNNIDLICNKEGEN